MARAEGVKLFRPLILETAGGTTMDSNHSSLQNYSELIKMKGRPWCQGIIVVT